MDLMAARRSLLMQMVRTDTTAKILEYGKFWARQYGVTTNNNGWGITDWIYFNPTQVGGPITICDTCTTPGVQETGYTYQYTTEDGSFKDWYYHDTNNERRIQSATNTKTLYKITFSIYLPRIHSTYAYCKETGQIFFAGRDTPYYGYFNLNDMPQ